MNRLNEFFVQYKDSLNIALAKVKLRQMLELWLEFVEKCEEKSKLKLIDFDDDMSD